MSYTINLYPDIEKIPDEPYFTKDIFSSYVYGQCNKVSCNYGLVDKTSV